MVQRLYTDEELAHLRSMRKRVSNPSSRWLEKPTAAPVHRQRSFVAAGEGGEEFRFEIYQREGLSDLSDFSCGIVYVALDGSRLTLARYNGPAHEHGDILYRTHVHRATERAIAAGMKPEREAEETQRYRTLEGALACLIDDFYVVGLNAVHDQPRLL